MDNTFSQELQGQKLAREVNQVKTLRLQESKVFVASLKSYVMNVIDPLQCQACHHQSQESKPDTANVEFIGTVRGT